MNIGIITVLWSLTPLMVAVMEYFVYSFTLKFNYIVGMCFMVLSAITLSLNNFLYVEPEKPAEQEVASATPENVIPSWIPVIFAVVTPMFFTGRLVLVRRLT